jgi:diguanylate cyclase (GGDEF)-like protein
MTLSTESDVLKTYKDFQIIIDYWPDGFLVFRDNCVVYANHAVCRLLDFAGTADLVGRIITDLVHPDSHPVLEASGILPACPSPNGTECDDADPGKRIDLQMVDAHGHPTAVAVHYRHTMLHGAPALCATVYDVRGQRQMEEQMRRQANYDALTGLPNRALFLDRLQHEIIRAKRNKSRVALMFIDLDRFKWVNDTLGHAAGDELLREVARRLLGCHRESDTVARLGGDEFTVILPDMAQGPHAERVAGQILYQLAQSFTLAGQEVNISGSIGVTVFPDDADDVDGLLKNADCAMYYAKNSGRNAYRFFTPDMHAEAQNRMAMEKELHQALEHHQLAVYYQPIVRLSDRRLIGAECFLRWANPKRGGLISPEIFIPMAEEIGLIAEITEWGLQTACAQAQQWRSTYRLPDFFISFNLSCTRCREFSTADRITGILEDTGLPPTALKLEITENILAEDPEKAMAMLNHLHQLGVKLWLDDFGTGNSSLSVLKRLPVAGVKIDRSFIPNAVIDHETELLVTAIVTLAKSLNRQVIGEGVETERQEYFLRQKGCDFAQGYLYGKPMNEHEFALVF